MEALRITVLAGGPSAEREVSLLSGRAVAGALRSGGHDVTLADVSPDDLSALEETGADLVFPVLHGTWGEDGQLQRILDDRGLAYPGSGPDSSALAMDKPASKAAFVEAGLPTPAWRVLLAPADRWDGELPVVVKPVAEGSSVDVSIARDPDQLRSTVEGVCRKYGRCMVEQYIDGRELTVGILGEGALPPIEIIVSGEHELYDYDAKYFDDETQYVTNPPLPVDYAGLGELAVAAHRRLGCRDYSRVDFMMDRPGRLFILEVNTVPGFTSHSLVPKAAAAFGLTFEALCQRLVELAWARVRAERDRHEARGPKTDGSPPSARRAGL